MLFLKAFVVGFAATLGVELALGFHYAVKTVLKGIKK